MFYDRKVKYLDYLVNGERIGSGGFVKLEVRNGCLRMELSAAGPHPGDTFERDIVFCGRSKESTGGRIMISAGRGQFRQVYQNADNIGGTGISYGELQGIRIPLGGGREISCSWQENEKANSRKEMAAAQQKGQSGADGRERRIGIKSGEEDAGIGGRNSEEEQRKETEKSRRRAETGKQGEGAEERQKEAADRNRKGTDTGRREGSWEGGQDGKSQGENSGRTNGRPVTEKHRSGAESGIRITGGREIREPEKPVPLLEDKWQQLYAIYPRIRPFDDGREYISIRPADFVLFPSESYKMANNSFLLHGYYNYRHLILARVERKGEIYYYIGVPGNFYEKEKQVAIMFGFESFECAEEPAQAGDFGYYMMRTEL